MRESYTRRRIAGGLLCFLVAASCPAIEEGGRKANLELPSEVTRACQRADRVALYGHHFEGNAFFFVVDRGRRMTSSGAVDQAKAELCRAIDTFSPGTQFGLVFFGTGVHMFPSDGRPAAASPAAKACAAAWVNSMGGHCGTSFVEGFREVLAFSRRFSGKSKVVVYVGSGPVHAGRATERLLREISSFNTEKDRIVCIQLVGKGPSNLLRRLVSASHVP